jgi:hypothetical protein
MTLRHFIFISACTCASAAVIVLMVAIIWATRDQWMACGVCAALCALNVHLACEQYAILHYHDARDRR